MSSPASDPHSAFSGFEFSVLGSYGGKSGALQGVSFWPRVAARLIDSFILLAISFLGALLFRMMILIANGGHRNYAMALKLHHFSLFNFVLGLFSGVLFHVVCEGLHGSTPGKAAFSMVVVKEDGSACRLASAFIRSLAYFIDALFFGLPAYFAMQDGPQEQRYGDRWAHTVVCKRDAVPPASLRGAGIFAGALFLAVLVRLALTLLGMLVQVMN